MSDIALRVEKLSKRYKVGARKQRHDALRDQLTHGFRTLFSRNGRSSAFDPQVSSLDAHPSDVIWALKNVSFDVQKGEIIGIIGRNGAGKSTLLKILSRITEPESGRVEVYGRVGCLLEVGTGFHPELSGRENVYLNGAIIGMKKAEVDRKFDEIVAFAEVEKFIDTPVKRYSSGMTVRLGFSVASSLEPDILIIDEVLGVGDLGFQRKCFERMEELINKRGTTVLLVSHNIRQVARICSRALLVDGGVIAREGDAAQICNEYFNLTYKEGVNASSKLSKAEKPARGSGEVELEEINLFRAKETTPTDELELHEPMRIGVKFRAQVDLIQPEIIIGFQTTDYLHVASTSSAAMKARPDFSKGDHYFECELQDLPLSPGIYKLRIGFLDRNRRLMVEHTNAKVFSILGGKRDITKTSAFGLVDLPFQWVFSTATEAFCNSYLSQPANSPPEKESIPLPRFTGGARK